MVSNAPLRVPQEPLIELVVVRGGFDAADDWIVEHAGVGDIAITADIPLAGRCLSQGVRVLGPKGLEFTEDAIGDALATRALLDMLRQSGEFAGGPAPFAKVRPFAVPLEARRDDPRGSTRPTEVSGPAGSFAETRRICSPPELPILLDVPDRLV